MKRLAILIFLIATVCGTAKAQVPVAQGCISPAVGSGTTITATCPTLPISGDLIVVQVSWFSTAATFTLADTCGSTWVIPLSPALSTNWRAGYAYTLSAGSSCSTTEVITATFNTGVTGDSQVTASVYNVSGSTLNCAPGTIGTGSSTAALSNTCNTTGSGTVLLVGMASTSTFTGWTVGGNGQGGTYSYLVGESGSFLGATEYMTVTSANTYSAAFTIASSNWVMQMFAFNVTVGGTANPVNSCIDSPNASPAQCTLYGVRANHLLVVPMFAYDTAVTVPSDTFGLSWTLGTSCNGFRAGIGNDFLGYAYAYTGANTGTDTIVVTAPGHGAGMTALEFQGVPVGSAPESDHCATGTNGSPVSISSGSFTPISNGDLIIGFGESTSTALNPGSGFTTTTGVPLNFQGVIGPILTEQQIQLTAASISATETQITTGGFFIMIGTSFQQVSPGGALRHRTGFY